MEQISESDRRDSADATTSSSTFTAAEDAQGGGGGGEAMARGLSTMLESVIKDFDSKALDTLNSQDQLSGSLDRLVQGTIYPLPDFISETGDESINSQASFLILRLRFVHESIGLSFFLALLS